MDEKYLRETTALIASTNVFEILDTLKKKPTKTTWQKQNAESRAQESKSNQVAQPEPQKAYLYLFV